MRITRREFMKYCAISAGALGLSTTDLVKLEKALATEYSSGGTHVVWLNGAACTGCTVSFANTMFINSVQNLLVPWHSVVSGVTGLANLDGVDGPLDLDFIETLSSSVGARAVKAAFDVLESGNNFVLCLEGAIQTAEDGDYCQIWRTTKVHSELKEDTFVYASADRDALGVTNDTSETVVLVNTRTVGGVVASTGGKIMLAAGSIIPGSSTVTLAANSWIEDDDDATAMGFVLVGTNKYAGAVLVTRTLTGRVELSATTNLTTSCVLTSNSIVRSATDRGTIGGTYTYAPKIPITTPATTKTVNNNRTLSGTVMIAAGSVLTTGTTLAMGSWIEDNNDRTSAAFGSPTLDANLKVQVTPVVLTDTRTLSGRVEALAGSKLDAFSVTTDTNYSGAGTDRTFKDEVLNFAIADSCKAVIAVGTCASFGGIPAAKGNETGARGLITAKSSGGYAKVNNEGYWDLLKRTGEISASQWTSLMAKTICVSGCPPHPDWIVGTIVYFVNTGEAPSMDKYHRPWDYYGEYQCTNCIWKVNETTRSANDIDNVQQGSKCGRTIGNSPMLFKKKYETNYEGCIGVLGCKGRKTKADCSWRRWNTNTTDDAGTGWCVLTRAGCHGCTEPRFPDGWGKFFSYK